MIKIHSIVNVSLGNSLNRLYKYSLHSSSLLFRWSKRSGHNKAQITYYIAENLELRKQEFMNCLVRSTGCSTEDAENEVDTTIQRLFHWAAFADKYGGNVQVGLLKFDFKKL